MLSRFLIVAFVIVVNTGVASAEDSVAGLLKDVKAVAKQGQGSPAARAAWDKLVQRGPEVLPRILEAMDTSDTVVANWLRTAFDQIVEAEVKAGGKKLDAEILLAFARDPKKQGRARRLARDAVERLQPGTTEKLVPSWLEDPEFRYEAVDHTLKEADALAREA